MEIVLWSVLGLIMVVGAIELIAGSVAMAKSSYHEHE